MFEECVRCYKLCETLDKRYCTCEDCTVSVNEGMYEEQFEDYLCG